jgi:hypothetical protein
MSFTKNTFLFFTTLFLTGGGTLFSQVATWSVNFNNGCAANCLATTYGGWTVQNNVGGASGAASNNWFVSCAEEGIAPPGCGSTCIVDQCLHIGANAGAGGDMGASFNETGLTNATYKMAVSPLINLTGVSSNTLCFDYIAYGSAACSNDRAQLRLSTDGGLTWPVGYQYCLTSLCCGACNGYSQGQWTLYSLALPAAFDNNPTVLVAFHWKNDGNGAGTDPSVAIDDARILSPVILPLTLLEFGSGKENGNTNIKWTTASEKNFSHFELQKSSDAKTFRAIGTVNSKGQGSGKSNYNFVDKEKNTETVYYRLKMIDKDNTFSMSKIISESPGKEGTISVLSQSVDNDQLTIYMNSAAITPVLIEVYDTRGKQMLQLEDQKLNPGDNTISVNIANLASAVYFLKVSPVADGKTQPDFVVQKFALTK